MATDEVLAAILGALEGGVGGWQVSRKMKREDEQQRAQQKRQADEDAYRAEQRDAQREDRDLRLRDRARTDTDQLLTSIGRGGVLTDAQAAGARDTGLGHRVEEAPDFQHSFFMPGGPAPVMAVPDVMSRVAPTGAERKADRAAADKQATDAAARKALQQAIEGLPAHLQGPASFGEASGKMPTLGAADFVTPEQRTQQEVARVTAIEKAKFPLALRQREAEKGIDRKFATMPIPTRDDPSMPQGVRAYLGDLVSRYQSDPAGARAELQRAAPNLLRDHPNLDLVKVTQQMNAMLPLPRLSPDEIDAAGKERMAAAAAKQAPGSSASLPAPAKAPTRPMPANFQPGGTATLANGQKVVVTRVYPDGTFDYK